jgi:hypothetical protein
MAMISNFLFRKGIPMNKTEVCMFCRYRRSRANGPAACCAAQEVMASRAETADAHAHGAARAIPERLRQPASRQQQPR